MSISLTKKQSISLVKPDGAGLTSVTMGLGWDPVKKKGIFGFGGGNGDIDLDASCLMLGASGNLIDTVWFRSLRSKDGSISHSGDNLTGQGDGDDEKISIDLTRVPASVQSLVFTVNSFRGQTFDEVAGAFCRLVDNTTSKEMAKYTLSGGGRHTAMIMARLNRAGQGWTMQALGEPGQGQIFEQLLPQIRQLG